MAKKADRMLITLACTTCKSRTYLTEKNKRNDAERLEINKYCPKCRTHRPHREAK